MLMAGINRRQLVWVGPKDYAADFARRFYKGMALCGDIFLQESDNQRFSEYARIARGRKHQVDAEMVSKMDVNDIFLLMLPPGQMARVGQYSNCVRPCAQANTMCSLPTWITTSERRGAHLDQSGQSNSRMKPSSMYPTMYPR